MSQFFYLAPTTRTILTQLENAGFAYRGCTDWWDEDGTQVGGFRLVIVDEWGFDDDDPNKIVRAIWEETGDAWEIELSKFDHEERENIALEKVIDLIQKGELEHRNSPGQLHLFEEAH